MTSTISPLQRQHPLTIKSDSDVTTHTAKMGTDPDYKTITQRVPKLTPKNKGTTTLIKHNNQQAQDNMRLNQKRHGTTHKEPLQHGSRLKVENKSHNHHK